jgi:hypothetical protein
MANPEKKLEKKKQGNKEIVVIKKEEQPAPAETPQQAPAQAPKEPEPLQTVFDTKIDPWNCILFRKQWRVVIEAVAGIKPGTPLKMEIKAEGIYLHKA